MLAHQVVARRNDHVADGAGSDERGCHDSVGGRVVARRAAGHDGARIHVTGYEITHGLDVHIGGGGAVVGDEAHAGQTVESLANREEGAVGIDTFESNTTSLWERHRPLAVGVIGPHP